MDVKKKKPTPFIPGIEAFTILSLLQARYRVPKKHIAGILGVPPQTFSDMKAGRRLFTWEMHNKLRDEISDEPYSTWLNVALLLAFYRFYAHKPNDWVNEQMREVGCKNEMELAAKLAEIEGAGKPAPTANAGGYPVLIAPVTGDPEEVPGLVKRRIPLPEPLASQAASVPHSYVLQIGYDTKNGRLRRGDLVLVLQDVNRKCEIMLIEFGGTIHLASLARNHWFQPDPERRIYPADSWRALDSGRDVTIGRPVGCVVGIVMALL